MEKIGTGTINGELYEVFRDNDKQVFVNKIPKNIKELEI